MALVNRLKEHRKLASLSQQQLADLADVHANTIRFCETGKMIPTLTIANKIAEAMGFTIDDVWPREDSAA